MLGTFGHHLNAHYFGQAFQLSRFGIGKRTRVGPRNEALVGCTLAPPGKYDYSSPVLKLLSLDDETRYHTGDVPERHDDAEGEQRRPVATSRSVYDSVTRPRRGCRVRRRTVTKPAHLATRIATARARLNDRPPPYHASSGCPGSSSSRNSRQYAAGMHAMRYRVHVYLNFNFDTNTTAGPHSRTDTSSAGWLNV